MQLSNVLIGFQNAEDVLALKIVPDKKMLFVENEATGSRFKLDSKFIRRDDLIDLKSSPSRTSGENDVVDWSEKTHYLGLRGSVVINRCTYNPFLLRSKENPERTLMYVTLNTNNVTLLKYETSYEMNDIISTLKNRKKGIVSAMISYPDINSIGDINERVNIITLYCYNISTSQYVRVNIGVERGHVVVNSTATLDKNELKYCRNNTKYHKGRSLTFKHHADGRPKYFVTDDRELYYKLGANAFENRVPIILSKPAKEFPVDQETHIRWGLVNEIKDMYELCDKVKAIELDKSLSLTFEEMYELRLSYVFTRNDKNELVCVKSN